MSENHVSVKDMYEGAPPETHKPWVGLTDEQIHNTAGYQETREMYSFVRAIEAKLKEKNYR